MITLDKRRVKAAAKKLGFYVNGNFLIGGRNNDVISGFAIDATPSAVYIWTFLLPAFDDITFFHMSLGERTIDLGLSEYPLEEALKNVWKPISDVREAGDIIRHLESEQVSGEYAKWTRFLCLVRLGKFDEAEGMFGTVESLQSASIPRKLGELRDARTYGGWPAVQDLLVDWSQRTDKLMSDLPPEIHAA